MLLFRKKQGNGAGRKPLIWTGAGSMIQDENGDFQDCSSPSASKKQQRINSKGTERPIAVSMVSLENQKRKRLGGLVRKMNCANNKVDDDFGPLPVWDETYEEPKPVMIRISDHSTTCSRGGIQQLQTPFSPFSKNNVTQEVVSTWLSQPPSPQKKKGQKVSKKWDSFTEISANTVGCGGGVVAAVPANEPNSEEEVPKVEKKETIRTQPSPGKIAEAKTKWKQGFRQASLTESFPSLIEAEESTITELSFTDDTGSVTDYTGEGTDETSEANSSVRYFIRRKYLETGELPEDTPLIIGVAQDIRLGAQMLLVGSAACLSIAASTAKDCHDGRRRRKK